jgi:hypothetical protein
LLLPLAFHPRQQGIASLESGLSLGQRNGMLIAESAPAMRGLAPGIRS